jgi:hypothetical protein
MMDLYQLDTQTLKRIAHSDVKGSNGSTMQLLREMRQAPAFYKLLVRVAYTP